MPLRNYQLAIDATLDVTGVNAATRGMVAGIKGGAAEAGQAWDGINAHVRGHAALIATATTALKGYFAILAAQAGPRALVSMADSWTNIGNRLRLVTANAAALGAAQGDVFRIATQTHQPLEATAQLYQRIAQNAGKLHLTQQQIAQVVTTISKGVALSGVSAADAQRGIVQLAQGLAAGTLRGQDLKSVLGQLPGVSQALAAGLGTDIAGLRAMAEQGQLTAQQVIQAFQHSAAGVDQQFASLKTTIGEAFTDIQSNAIRYIGTLNQAIDGNRVFGGALEAVAEHINVVAAAIGAVAVSKLTRMALDATFGLAGLARSTIASTVAATQNALAQGNVAAAALHRADAERFVALQAAQSARADVAKAGAALNAAKADRQAAAAALQAATTDAEKATARTAATATTRAVTLAEREYTAAQRISTAATGVAAEKALALAAAERVAATATLTFGTAAKAALGVLGGSVGLIAMVAAAVAGWALFRAGTDQVADSLGNLQTPMDQAIAKFRELTALQRQSALAALSSQVDVAAAQSRVPLFAIANNARLAGGDAYAQVRAQVMALARQMDTGVVSADDLDRALTQIIDRTFPATAASSAEVRDRVKELALQVIDAYGQSKGLIDRYDALKSAGESAAGSTTQLTAALASQSGQLGMTAANWGKYLDNLQNQANRAGLTAKALAEYDARAKGASDQQAQLAGVVASQTAAWQKYQKAIQDGDKAGAASALKTLDTLTAVQVKAESVIRATQQLARLPAQIAAAQAKGDAQAVDALQKQLSLAQYIAGGQGAYADIAARAGAANASHRAGLDTTPSRRTPAAAAASSNNFQQQQQAIQQAIAQQDLLTAAVQKYGAAAQGITEGDKRLLAIDLQLQLAQKDRTGAYKNLTDAQLNQLKAGAQDEAAREHANVALQQHAQLLQFTADAARELAQAEQTRERGNARSLAALTQGDHAREASARMQAIDDENERRRQQYQQHIDALRASGQSVDQKQVDAYFKSLDRARAADVQAENRYQAQLAAARGSATAGMTRALNQYMEQAADIASQTEGLFTHAFSGMEDALVSFATTGKLSFKDFANSVIADLTRIAIRATISGILSRALSFGAGPPGIAASVASSAIGSAFSSSNPNLFGSSMPAFAGGGIVPGAGGTDSVLARVTPGEGVFTPEQMARLAPASRSGASFVVNVAYNEAPGKDAGERQQDRDAFTRGLKETIRGLMVQNTAEDLARGGPISRSYQSAFGLRRNTVPA